MELPRVIEITVAKLEQLLGRLISRQDNERRGGLEQNVRLVYVVLEYLAVEFLQGTLRKANLTIRLRVVPLNEPDVCKEVMLDSFCINPSNSARIPVGSSAGGLPRRFTTHVSMNIRAVRLSASP